MTTLEVCVLEDVLHQFPQLEIGKFSASIRNKWASEQRACATIASEIGKQTEANVLLSLIMPPQYGSLFRK